MCAGCSVWEPLVKRWCLLRCGEEQSELFACKPGCLVWPAAALPCIYEWHSAVLQYPRKQKHSTGEGTGGQGALLKPGLPGQEGCVGSVPTLVELYNSMATPTTVCVVASTPVCRRHGKGGSQAITVATCFSVGCTALGCFGLGWHTCVLWASNSKSSPVLSVAVCRHSHSSGWWCLAAAPPSPWCAAPLQSCTHAIFPLQVVLFLFIHQSHQAGCTMHAAASWRAELPHWLCLPCLSCVQAAACWQLRARWLLPQLLERIHVL